MTAAQAGERRRIVAGGLGAHLRERSQAGGDGKRGAAEKVATVDLVGHESILYRNFA